MNSVCSRCGMHGPAETIPSSLVSVWFRCTRCGWVWRRSLLSAVWSHAMHGTRSRGALGNGQNVAWTPPDVPQPGGMAVHEQEATPAVLSLAEDPAVLSGLDALDRTSARPSARTRPADLSSQTLLDQLETCVVIHSATDGLANENVAVAHRQSAIGGDSIDAADAEFDEELDELDAVSISTKSSDAASVGDNAEGVSDDVPRVEQRALPRTLEVEARGSSGSFSTLETDSRFPSVAARALRSMDGFCGTLACLEERFGRMDRRYEELLTLVPLCSPQVHPLVEPL